MDTTCTFLLNIAGFIVNDSTAKKLLSKDICPDGANTVTEHIEYACPCGKGKVIYENVRGFHDNYAWIECEECSKLYRIEYGKGHLWELVKK